MMIQQDVYSRNALPPFADALLALSEAQESALVALAQCGADDEARRSVEHWIRAWDKALGRGDTIALQDRIGRAKRAWAGHVYEDGAGI